MQRTRPCWERDEGTVKLRCGFLLIRVRPRGVVTETINPGYLFTINGIVSANDYTSEADAQKAALERAGVLLGEALDQLCLFEAG